ncbi:hypothetical protein BKA66DRAFT_319209 [Pyrenochaeta sp. MPI-SDFR-AT-0127]|nr:hypothetical protein BKA66DRAFT_319209 [Pyrenochaeta sp. MPI-SDFR-AT-0127]
MFSPSLEQLHTVTQPVHLRLFKKIPIEYPNSVACSRFAPIGTGRPHSYLLLAESDKHCKSAAAARCSLACALLSDKRMLGATIDKYYILATLHHLCTSTLLSIHRGLLFMSSISDIEWIERLYQLRGVVNGCNAVEGVNRSCDVELRLETYMLGIGRAETDGWIQNVSVASSLDEEDRRGSAEVYTDAAAFLGKALREMYPPR